MLLKKVKWYKYANINKAIRKPPVMTNMPFEKKKKRFLYILFTESERGKGVCYLLEQKRSPLPYLTFTFCAEIKHTQVQPKKVERSGLEA